MSLKHVSQHESCMTFRLLNRYHMKIFLILILISRGQPLMYESCLLNLSIMHNISLVDSGINIIWRYFSQLTPSPRQSRGQLVAWISYEDISYFDTRVSGPASHVWVMSLNLWHVSHAWCFACRINIIWRYFSFRYLCLRPAGPTSHVWVMSLKHVSHAWRFASTNKHDVSLAPTS